ncbi:hypothetical protein OIU78_026488 [Salix suchowensis]|nr:hypothetical protein OIU78_026488 [Salix suchowensis]
MGYPTLLKNPTTPKFSISTTRPSLPFPHINSKTVPHTSRISISALSQSHGPRRTSKNGSEYFASISSSSGQQTASVGVNPQSVSPPPSQIGSPLFWVGVGVALSAFFSWVATRLKVSSYLLQGTNVCSIAEFSGHLAEQLCNRMTTEYFFLSYITC